MFLFIGKNENARENCEPTDTDAAICQR